MTAGEQAQLAVNGRAGTAAQGQWRTRAAVPVNVKTAVVAITQLDDIARL